MTTTDAEWELQMYGPPTGIESCPVCAQPFKPFRRYEVSQVSQGSLKRFANWFYGKPTQTALICWKCKEIIGWE